MAFDSWANPEVIGAICAGIGTILGALGVFISKLKGKSLKEILSGQNKEAMKIIKEEFDKVVDIANKEAEIIKEVIHKQHKDSVSEKPIEKKE